ncbi:MAG TPA: polysaccharide biosynthesis C-terminal domain-containing protein [Roseiflexaceae bacterium]|nr:polysaccharide biosynthesis C-terminal domain-containing protein [Roseiflexaceae bacterium]
MGYIRRAHRRGLPVSDRNTVEQPSSARGFDMMLSTMLRLRSLWKEAFSSSQFGALLVLTIVTNALLAGLGLLSSLLAARLLGPTGRGELAAIQTWPTLLAVLALLGTADALVYFSAREPKQADRWLSTAICIALLACLPFALIGYMLMPWLLGAQNQEVVQAARVFLWFLPIQAVIGMLPHPLRGRNDLVAWNLIRPLPNLVWVGLLLFDLARHAANPILLTQQYLIALALLCVPIGAVVIRRLRGSFQVSKAHVYPLIKFGMPSVLTTVPSMLNLRLDQMIMAGMLGSQILGLYVIGVAWSNSVVPLLSAVAATLLPRVAGAPAEIQVPLLAQSVRLGLLFAMLSAPLMALAAPVAIPMLFGRAFAPAVPAAMVLCLAAGMTAFNQVLASGANSLGRPHFSLIAESAGLVATLGLLGLLLPRLQLIGAALASLGSYTVVSVVLIHCIKRQTGLSLPELLKPKLADFRHSRNGERTKCVRSN